MRTATTAMLALALIVGAGSARAAVSAGEAARLGQELTCIGGERAGNAEGTIPAYSGEYVDYVPGWNHQVRSGGKVVDPFADETPRLVLTAANYREHQAHLSAGQMALFEAYPQTYKINVYATKRIFGLPNHVCENARWNAQYAELRDDGLMVKGLGQIPFPIPKQPLEVLWNHLLAPGVWVEDVLRSTATVLPNGSIGWSRLHGLGLSMGNRPYERPVTEGVRSYSNTRSIAPPRDAGTNTISHEYYDWAGSGRIGWRYDPGTRRVRMLPAYGFDQPMVGSNGAMVIDDDRLFNGSPERYQWELLGKREMYVPANAFKVNSGKVKYADLLTVHHPKPDYFRYELRRVWVLQGTLKPNYRHVYSKRVLYLDEDTWNAVMADNFDGRGQLWKHNFLNYYHHPDAQLVFSGAQFFHDLNSRSYVAYSLTNEEPRGPILNREDLTADMFTPDVLRAAGL